MLNIEQLNEMLDSLPPKVEATIELECEICGKVGVDVRPTVDPYNEELYDEKNLVLWCSECLSERAMDI